MPIRLLDEEPLPSLILVAKLVKLRSKSPAAMIDCNEFGLPAIGFTGESLTSSCWIWFSTAPPELLR